MSDIAFARKLVVTKRVLRPSNASFIKSQLDKVTDRILTEGRVKNGWGTYLGEVTSSESTRTVSDEDGSNKRTVPEYVFDVELIVYCAPKRGRRSDVMDEEFDKISDIVATNVNGKKFELSKTVVELDPSVIDLSLAAAPPAKERKKTAKKKVKKAVTVEATTSTETTPAVELATVSAE
jgi:hypothetical protein